MTDAPEKIHMGISPSENHYGMVYHRPMQWGVKSSVEYIRADLVDQWEPFETMPEDEFVLITFTNRWGYPRVHEAVKYTNEDGEEVVHTVYEQNVINSVTHWKPLPEPSKELKNNDQP